MESNIIPSVTKLQRILAKRSYCVSLLSLKQEATGLAGAAP